MKFSPKSLTQKTSYTSEDKMDNQNAEQKEVENTSDENLAVDPREDAVEIEVEGDEPESEVAATEETSDEPRAQEKSESQKRIDRLTKLRREAERREADALKYAEAKQREAEELKARLDKLDQGYVQEYSGRVESEMEAAKNALRQAMSIGDTDAAVEAQEKLSSLTFARERARQAQMQYERRAEEAPAQEVAQPQAPQQAAPARPDPKAEEWADKNEWFGKDEAMTYAAFGIHKRLVENEGFDPNSDEYYNELDKRIGDEFPHKLGKTSPQGTRPVQTVASASRTAKNSGRRKVKLTPSQVAIAKKLGVPLDEYAKYVKE